MPTPKNQTIVGRAILVAGLLASLPGSAAAARAAAPVSTAPRPPQQTPADPAARSPAAAAIATWTAVDMATGYETRDAPRLAAAMPGWDADGWGNLVRVVGEGGPERVVACALDRPSYAVSRITQDGYLRVHRIGRGSRHPLWDQAHEAQQIRILTAQGPVAGVVARSNGHFAAQHANETALVTADDLWIDVGARSDAEVEALGIGLLDPVARHVPPWVVGPEAGAGGAVVAPDAGRRAGCAAVASVAEAAAARAASGRQSTGRTRFVMSAQEVFGWVGLSSLLARGGPVDAVLLVAPGEDASGETSRPASEFGGFGQVLDSRSIAVVRVITPGVRDAGALLEWVDVDEVRSVRAAVAAWVGLPAEADFSWVSAPPPADLRTPLADPTVAALAGTLTDLVRLHAVPGHEWAVRRYVLEHLPGWAQALVQVDDIGNIVLAVGPDRDTTVFMAHMDEVGYEVTGIAADGTLSLATRGGAVSSAWEGQTALLHFDPAGAPSSASGTGEALGRAWVEASLGAAAPPPLRGRFSVRSEPVEKYPGSLTAHFGMTAPELAARGVSPGIQVTSYKEGLRLGATRYTARALDDRAGTAALLAAVRALDPQALLAKVVFTWSVHEEGGLVGAAALARRFGATARRIYSVDTFVSSDTPLESDHFAWAPLGAGPVVRSIENSSISPPAERERTLRIARNAGIPVQFGLTQGGTDGTRFTFWGAPNQGLSWPGRYSHSPGEVLDLTDLARLRDLILAVAVAP